MATLSAASEDTRVYEVAVLYPYPMNQKEEQDLLKGIDEIFAEAGAKLLMKDAWGRRGLAYMIGGFTEGNILIYYFDMDPLKVKEVDVQMRILKGVLRHMIVKPPKKYQMVPYADRLAQWQEQEKLRGEKAVADKEEKLKKQVVDKAKRTAKVAPKLDAAPAKPMTDASITEGLEKLISDKDLEM